MAKIAITDWANLDPTPAVDVLERAGHEAVLLNSTSVEKLLAEAADADGIIASFTELSADTLRAMPNLKVIATMAVGYNKIDTVVARELGIDVCNMLSAASEEVATHALAGMLGMLREVAPAVAQVKGGEWDYSVLPLPNRLSEQTLGLFSLGRISREVARRALPFFKDVVAFDPFVPADAWEPGVTRVDSVDELLAASNVLSLHALLTDETHGFLNAENIAKLPRGAYIVNVARGELIDDAALLEGLNSGQLRGAFLDVLDVEPPAADNPVVAHPLVQVTPHVAFRSEVTLREYATIPAENVTLVLSGQKPHTLVN